MPCGYANPTEIGARERFKLVVFIFRVRPLQVCSVLLRWAIPGPRLVERANSKVLTLFCISAKPESHMPLPFRIYGNTFT